MADTEYGTILGPDANFKGDLSFESAAKVLGRFEGSISSKGRVHVADGANLKASIAANEVTVEGEILGNVEASDRVDLKPTGRINGDIVAARMVMAEGASIDGHIRIGTNGKSSPGSQSRTAEVKPDSQPAVSGKAAAKS
jgi:cytoskeletal protein CcmA (bactofilin family)